MELSSVLLKDFAKTIVKKEEQTAFTTYGRAVVNDDKYYVQLDGANELTPVTNTVSMSTGDRVVVTIQDHIATVSGNITSPPLTAAQSANSYPSIASFNQLSADVMYANQFSAKYLEANEAWIGSLTADSALIKKLESPEINSKLITTETIKAAVADVGYLTAESAVITDLQAYDGKIQNLIYGSASGTQISATFASAVNAQLTTSQIINGVIMHLSADTIDAGKINTNKVEVVSDDGSMLMKNSLLQFVDENKDVRIQIGKDATGDYTFIIVGSDGATIMDQNGIKTGAIPDGLIVDEMVSDNTKIQGHKLDIGGIVDEINENGEYAFYTDSIYYDDEKHTLTSLLSKQSSQIEGLENKVAGDFQTYDVTEPPTWTNYPTITWATIVYPGNETLPKKTLYPSSDKSPYWDPDVLASHLYDICYYSYKDSDGKNRVKGYMFDKNENNEYYWREVDNNETVKVRDQISQIDQGIDCISARVFTTGESYNPKTGKMEKTLSSQLDMTESKISLVVSETGSAGGESYVVNAANITAAINDKESSVTINADKINFTGFTTFARVDDLNSGNTTINGDCITTGSIKSSNYISNVSGTKISLTDGSIDTKGFKVDKNGVVTLNSGTIIVKGNLPNGNIPMFILYDEKYYTSSDAHSKEGIQIDRFGFCVYDEYFGTNNYYKTSIDIGDEHIYFRRNDTYNGVDTDSISYIKAKLTSQSGKTITNYLPITNGNLLNDTDANLKYAPISGSTNYSAISGNNNYVKATRPYNNDYFPNGSSGNKLIITNTAGKYRNSLFYVSVTGDTANTTSMNGSFLGVLRYDGGITTIHSSGRDGVGEWTVDGGSLYFNKTRTDWGHCVSVTILS